jgi:hypothetical protein
MMAMVMMVVMLFLDERNGPVRRRGRQHRKTETPQKNQNQEFSHASLLYFGRPHGADPPTASLFIT